MTKKITAILAAGLSFALILSACSSAEANAEKALKDMMSAFKSCNEEQIDLYYDFDKVSAYIKEADGEEFKDAVLSTLSEVEYEINSAQKLGSDTVKFNIALTTIDYSAVIDEYVSAVIDLVGSREYQSKSTAMSDAEYKRIMSQQMIKAIDNAKGKTKTKTIDVTMKKSDGKWILSGDTRLFLGTLFENLSNAVNSLI